MNVILAKTAGFCFGVKRAVDTVYRELAREDGVPLIAADSFAWPLAAGETLETSVELERKLTGPLRAGTRVGEAVFSLNGKEVGRVGLLCGEDLLPKAESAMTVLRNYR